ncbi:heterocyst frequency control protein PatD [Coleofasciculus sp. LEGE 07092]|nr:heterocyst frequency control protein PatD [Coleofasciculus sp. LEGE 07081]MBE9147622.1 heterocyst frequency control protein PatD [Coleofasciculus sp. LEGE 07092]
MLAPSQSQHYQKFQQALEQLYDRMASPDLEVATILEPFQAVKQLYYDRIASLSADNIAPDFTSRWQSVQTEIHKQIRLLETDMMLLQASRSSATFNSRASGIRDRLNTLIQYCQSLLQF